MESAELAISVLFEEAVWGPVWFGEIGGRVF